MPKQRAEATCSHCSGPLYFDDDYAATNNAGAAPSLKCRTCGRGTYLDAKGQPVVLVPLPAPTEQRIRVMHAQGVSNGTIAHRLHCNVELVVQVLAGLPPSELVPYGHDDRGYPTTGADAQPDMD